MTIFSSTHNTRIERLWVEVGKQFMRAWHAFFLRLERLYSLKRKNGVHLWLICELFVSLINADCKTFVEVWNNHSINNADIGHMTPNASRIPMKANDSLMLILGSLLCRPIEEGNICNAQR